MDKMRLSLIVVSILLMACGNSFEKEDKEIDSLLVLVNSSEELLNSVDTAKVFTLVRDIKKELWAFGNKYDTLDKETAIKVADYYGRKKSLYFLNKNYQKLNNEIGISRTQLKALQQDLHNGAITKEQFFSYLKNEQEIIVQLNNKVADAVNGIDATVNTFIEERPVIMNLLEKYQKDTLVANE